ncbi:hypothetical protein [Gemmatimonas sp.]|uniref:hypothetical protein n=1 Tax=Gemmatimonas sp. TaxID=1962908 RepID=UPI00356286FE
MATSSSSCPTTACCFADESPGSRGMPGFPLLWAATIHSERFGRNSMPLTPSSSSAMTGMVAEHRSAVTGSDNERWG